MTPNLEIFGWCHDTKLFHLVCPSPAGDLPLGTILTSGEDEAKLSAAISFVQTGLPGRAFFRKRFKSWV